MAYKKTKNSEQSIEKCSLCNHENQFVQHLHFLKDFQDIHSLRNHLQYNIRITARGGKESQEGNITATCEWRNGIEHFFKLYPYADENGRALFLWEWWVMSENLHIRTKEDLHARMRKKGYAL